ncbi:MAG: hypothetical protein ABJQ69_21850 [Ekhidna sp.]|uniref:toxin-antitoxin system YwqK family antitoxin n=1 Tax=Reichenbachiella sp. TaxID=2184521 RepID=UPI003262E826
MNYRILSVSLLFLAHLAFSQSLEEKRTYYDPYVGAHLKEIWTVKSGTATKHGTYKAFDKKGGPISEANYKDNYLDGDRKEYHTVYNLSTGQLRLHQKFQSGELVEETSYLNDGTKNYHKIVNGTWTFWHKDGSIAMTAILYPNGKWNGVSWDLAESNADAPKGDDFYVLNGLGDLIKIKEVKRYSEGNLVSENYFGDNGLTVKYIDYNSDGQKTSEWNKYPDSDLYNEVIYYDNGNKATSTEFILSRKPNTGEYKHYEAVVNGLVTQWDEDGNVLSQGNYINNKRTGRWIIYFDQHWNEISSPDEATFYREIEFDDEGTPIGIVRDFYASGKLQFEGRLLQVDPEVKDGECRFYYENGNLSTIENHKDGLYNGPVTIFNENGDKVQVDYVLNNSVERREIWSNNKRAEEATFVNMKYPVDQGGFKDFQDFMVSKYKSFHDNGRPSSVGMFNVMNGTSIKMDKWEYFDESGSLIRSEFYDPYGNQVQQPAEKLGRNSNHVKMVMLDATALRKDIDSNPSINNGMIYNAFVQVYDGLSSEVNTLPEVESYNLVIKLKQLCSRMLSLSGEEKDVLKNKLQNTQSIDEKIAAFGL